MLTEKINKLKKDKAKVKDWFDLKNGINTVDTDIKIKNNLYYEIFNEFKRIFNFCKNVSGITQYKANVRVDGFNKADLADFISKQLKIPSHHIDNIDMSNKFSLFSLPQDEANELLKISSRNKNFPHVHIDSKTTFSRKRFGGKDRFDDDAQFRKKRFGDTRRPKKDFGQRSGKFDEGGQKKRRFGRQYKSTDIY
jgi:hypothetical protein